MNPKCLVIAMFVAFSFGQDAYAYSDEFIILGAVTECVKEYNLDRIDSTPVAGAATPTDEQGRANFYIQRALAENLALKHCENARAMLHPMLETADPELNKAVASLDSSFEIREKLHNRVLEIIDRVTSSSGHAKVSEVGKTGADAIEGLNIFRNSTVAIFSSLTPLLSPEERNLLAQKITALFPDDQKAYDKEPTKVRLPEEVMMIMVIRDRLLGK